VFNRWMSSYAITNRPLSGCLKYATRELESVADCAPSLFGDGGRARPSASVLLLYGVEVWLPVDVRCMKINASTSSRVVLNKGLWWLL
jgi:hypothetical protein